MILFFIYVKLRIRKLEEVAKHEELPPHPNFVKFYRAWEEKQRLYIQTELCQMRYLATNNHPHTQTCTHINTSEKKYYFQLEVFLFCLKFECLRWKTPQHTRIDHMAVHNRLAKGMQTSTRQKPRAHGHQTRQHFHFVRWSVQAGRFWFSHWPWKGVCAAYKAFLFT